MILLVSLLFAFASSSLLINLSNNSSSRNGDQTSCQTGLIWTRYFNEISFINPAESYVIDTLNKPKFNFGYNSIQVKGSFCPSKTGKYRLQVTGRPYCQLIFNGIRAPETIGPAGNCWPSTHSQHSISDQYLNANQCYSFLVNARTGCTLYSQYLYLSVFYNDEPTEIFPTSEYMTCEVNDCRDGYYGETCDKKCDYDCGEHGFCFNGTKGNGKCICNDQWGGPDCNQKIDIIPPKDGKVGALYTVYRNEISFLDPSSEEVISTPNVDSIGNVFNSMTIKGSILPEVSGQYQFRIEAKPYGQFNFEGTHTPSTLGPAGCCLGSIVTDYETQVFTLNKHTMYPYEVSYRSGCGIIYDKRLHLYWKNGPKWGGLDKAPWERIPSHLLFVTTEDKQCVPTAYGNDCENICQACPSNMVCYDGMSGDGTCVCPSSNSNSNSNGECYCSPVHDPCENKGECLNGICQCPTGFFGHRCERYCDANLTCHGNGRCEPTTGLCICDSGHTGEDCRLKCTRRDTCSGHGECIGEGGECTCDEGWHGNTCAHHEYQRSPRESKKGVDHELYHNEFFSGGTDHKVLDVMHRDCQELYHSAIATGSLVSYNKTKVQVRMRAKPYGEIRLDWEWKPSTFGPAGACLPGFETDEIIGPFTMFPNRLYPFRLAWRSGCSLYPQHLYLEWRHTVTPRGITQINSNDNDNELSDVNMLGDEYSEWETVPNENLRAAPHNQMCLERYSGEFCNYYCDKDCNMNGDCVLDSKGNAKCMCFDAFYGENCEFHCDPVVNCSSGGRCDNDKCICDPFHSGEHCEVGCSRESTCNNHGNCVASSNSVNKFDTDKKKWCECDEGWEGDTCAQHIYIPSLNETIHGINVTFHTTESDTSSVTNMTIIDHSQMNFTSLLWNAVTLKGAIVTRDHIRAKLRFTAKPHGQLIFNNKEYKANPDQNQTVTQPKEIGPSLSCWGTTITEEEIDDEFEFLPNKLYPFTLRYKSGCSFIQQFVKLEWIVAEMGADWKEITSENLVIPKNKVHADDEEQNCLDRYEGENCQLYCDTDCSLNGECIIVDKETKESVCKCFPGFSGTHCDIKEEQKVNVENVIELRKYGNVGIEDDQNKDRKDNKYSAKIAVVGSAAAVTLLVLAAAFGAVYLIRKRKEEKEIDVSAAPLIHA